MAVEETYKVRFFHEARGEDGSKYSTKDINFAEYEELESHRRVRQLLRDIIEAYEHIVLNYRDFELRNFSIVLDHTLLKRESESIFLARSEINRHLTNMLSSTYLYTCLLRINRKDNCIDDYSMKNSKDPKIVHALKEKFQATTNRYHKERYQYTFMSALRNIINHGGSFEKITEIGGEWSIRHGVDNAEGDAVLRKDKRYSILDQKVSKDQVRKILKNNHYKEIEQELPESFYIREAVRMYVDLFSTAHSELKRESESTLAAGESLIRKHMSVDSDYMDVSVIKCVDGMEHTSESLGGPSSVTVARNETANSPLHLEHYTMPGEPSAVPKRQI